MNHIFGGVEAGGTKFVCLAGTSPDHIDHEIRFPTTSPEETIQKVIDFFQPYKLNGSLGAIGIGTFGPVDLDMESPTYGYITSTPKPGWRNVDLRGLIHRSLRVPVAFDTDVNVAAFGEMTWIPESRQMDPFIYITIGTGIGVGVIINSKPVHGLVHIEGGHMLIPHNRTEDPFPGICPYHEDCWEGLASGPAIKARWGISAQEIPDDHPAWDLEARYIASAIANCILVYSPKRIVLGGGVSQHPGLIDKVRNDVISVLNGYVRADSIDVDIDHYIIPPQLGNLSGGLGALALAKQLMPQHLSS